MDTKVIGIPFVAGINEYDDPDQLQAPELVNCKEAVVRRPGRIETRNGFTLVDGDSGVPANAFKDAFTLPYITDKYTETVDAYYGQNGTRPIMSAGSKLYELVDSDTTHGWREVNRLPTYVGSLVGVTASGGSIIEVESIEDVTGKYRLRSEEHTSELQSH